MMLDLEALTCFYVYEEELKKIKHPCLLARGQMERRWLEEQTSVELVSIWLESGLIYTVDGNRGFRRDWLGMDEEILAKLTHKQSLLGRITKFLLFPIHNGRTCYAEITPDGPRMIRWH